MKYFIFTLFIIKVVHGQLYEDDYSYDDEEDGSLGEEYEVLQQVRPQFNTQPQHFKVPQGHTVRLPCQVENLGHMVTSWKKVNPHHSASPEYLTAGKHKLSSDPKIKLEEVTQLGSTLVIDQISLDSVGDYVCEVSSNPPATLRHELSILSPPTATILKERRTYKIDAGQELALVCSGTGDPQPVLKWRRERKRLPDGREEIVGNQIIYQNVTRKHSGTYICEASNGPGQSAIDSVVIDVQHKPEILGEQTYVEKDEGIQMELVCIVHGSPPPHVTWTREGHQIPRGSERVRATKIGRKHLLTIDRLTAEADAGTYQCVATNSKGQSSTSFQVLDSSSGREGRLADIHATLRPSLPPPPPPNVLYESFSTLPPPQSQAFPSEASSSPSDNPDTVISWILSTSLVFANVLLN